METASQSGEVVWSRPGKGGWVPSQCTGQITPRCVRSCARPRSEEPPGRHRGGGPEYLVPNSNSVLGPKVRKRAATTVAIISVISGVCRRVRMQHQIVLRHRGASDRVTHGDWVRAGSYRRISRRIFRTAGLTRLAFYHVTRSKHGRLETDATPMAQKECWSPRPIHSESTQTLATRLCPTARQPTRPRLLPSNRRRPPTAHDSQVADHRARPSMTARTISHLILLTAITGNLGP